MVSICRQPATSFKVLRFLRSSLEVSALSYCSHLWESILLVFWHLWQTLNLKWVVIQKSGTRNNLKYSWIPLQRSLPFRRCLLRITLEKEMLVWRNLHFETVWLLNAINTVMNHYLHTCISTRFPALFNKSNLQYTLL